MYPERSQLIDGSGKPKILLVNERETWWEFACLKKIAATGSSCILIFSLQLQQTVLAEHINVLYGELMGLLDHTNQDIQCQAKRALRSIFAFRIMYTK